MLGFHTADVGGTGDRSTSGAKTQTLMIDRVSEQRAAAAAAAAVLLLNFPCVCLGSLSVMTQ